MKILLLLLPFALMTCTAPPPPDAPPPLPRPAATASTERPISPHSRRSPDRTHWLPVLPTWSFDAAKSKLAHSLRNHQNIISLKVRKRGWSDLLITFVYRHAPVKEVKGHEETLFVVTSDGKLIYTTQHPISSGCGLTALELATGKELLTMNLKGLGPISHSKYRNRINIEYKYPHHLVIFGNESSGKYVEVVDLRSHTTILHTLVR